MILRVVGIGVISDESPPRKVPAAIVIAAATILRLAFVASADADRRLIPV